MQSRMSRLVRGWMAGSFATGIAALSHGLADRAAPSAVALTTALVFAGMLGTFAIGRRPSLPRLAIVVTGSQLAFHLVFSWLTPGSATTVGHHGASELLAPAVAHHGTDPVMWLAHAVAAAATVLFLARAERALWTLFREALEAATVARVTAVTTPATPIGTTPTDAARHPVAFLFLSVVSHRGPPAFAAA